MAIPPPPASSLGRLLRRWPSGRVLVEVIGRLWGAARFRRHPPPYRSGLSWGSSRSAGATRGAWPGRRRHSPGSALVQALMAGLIAVIAAFALASRLMASRLGNFSRGDSLAAREAAEYGLNEIQAQLNTDDYGYLWVSKFSASTSSKGWGKLTKTDLNDCRLKAIDSSGTEISTPGIPAGVASARTIRSSGDTTIAYQVTDFVPPALPDSASATLDQANFCISRTAANNFGNLYGGSALITVTGTVTRGSGSTARTTSFKLSRRSHVQTGSSELAFSFMILGDAYYDPSTKESFGAASDISKLNYFDGNICYAQASTNLASDTCFSPMVLPKTLIGCRDLGSCLVNNVDNVDTKLRSKYCADVKAKKKKKAGYTCNDFQQAATLPSPPTPRTEGFLTSTGATYTDADWTASLTSVMYCKIKEGKCDDKDNKNGEYDAMPPYRGTKVPTSLSKLTNSSLIDGCYFNNVSAAPASTASANTTAINCLFQGLTIVNADGTKKPNLVFDTSLLPVNIFLYGPGTTNVTLNDGGIDNSDSTSNSWKRLRILGKAVATPAGSAVSCSQSASITSTKGNDLNDLFLWLPNAALNYNRQASKDSAYTVVWVCEFTGPVKGGKGNKYSIITPLPEEVLRAGLVEMLGSRFTQSSGSSYRGIGAKDTPIP